MGKFVLQDLDDSKRSAKELQRRYYSERAREERARARVIKERARAIKYILGKNIFEEFAFIKDKDISHHLVIGSEWIDRINKFNKSFLSVCYAVDLDIRFFRTEMKKKKSLEGGQMKKL